MNSPAPIAADPPRPRPPGISARPVALGLALLAVVACDRRDVADLAHTATAEPLPPLPPTPPPTATPLPVPDRRCGEAGEQPTDLPPDLERGRTPIGSVTLHPGDRLTLGASSLFYDPSAWIGTHRAGHRGPALGIEIDRAEVGPHDPWGTQAELRPESEQHTFVGPYRFDVRAGAGAPPADVAVTVTRDTCPASAIIAPTDASRSLWLSTEGIRGHTYDLAGELLRFTLDGRGDSPRLDIADLGYRHSLEPRPDVVRRLRVGAHIITLDRVVPGPGTRFDGAWQADGDARLHVRLRIDPAVPAPQPAPAAASSECGESPVRTDLPAALATMPPITATRSLGVGQSLELGPLSFNYSTFELPERQRGLDYREAEVVPQLQISAGRAGGRVLARPRMNPQLVRLGRELVRVDPDGPDERVQLRRVTVACPQEHTLRAPSGPVYVWLSALGRGLVTITGSGSSPLSLELHAAVAEPSLALGSEHAFLSHPLRPDSVGTAYTFDGHLVEIVDVVPGPDTRHDGQRWQSGGLLPVVHVQLAVTPQPDGP